MRDLSPAPILDLFENYAGSFRDLDRGLELNGDSLRAGRDQLVHGLKKLGLNAGDRVLFSMGNGPGFVATLAAVLTVGGSPVILHFETPPAELKRLASTYAARFALSEMWTPDDLAPASVSTVRLEFAPDGGLTAAAMDPGKLPSGRQFPSIPSVPLHPTSGTTGAPKIAVRHGAVAVAEARNYQQTMEITVDDTSLCVVPMSHSYGYGTSVMLPLLSGARVVSSRRFQPHTVFRALRECTITTFPAVPAMLHLLLVAAREKTERLPKRVLSAGAPLSEQTARAFFDHAGQTVWSLYGTTETGGISIDVQPQGISVNGGVGPAMSAVSVNIRALSDPASMKEGIGRVWIKSPSVMAGYLTRDGIDSSRIVDGWFETGDLGYLDESGGIHLVGRESDVINVFGMKVIPSEVEAVIRDVVDVADVIVYAGEHRSGSQIVKAAVAGPESLDEETIRKHCAEHLVGYKRPDVITRLDALPRTLTGKIIRDRLP